MEKNKGGRPRSFYCNETLKKQVDAFFEYCDSKKEVYTDDKGRMTVIRKPYTITGLCLYLEINGDTFREYIKGVYDDKNNTFSATFTCARKKIENYIEEGTLNGTINHNAGAFNLKNNFNWKEKQEIDLKVEDITVTVTNEEEEVDD